MMTKSGLAAVIGVLAGLVGAATVTADVTFPAMIGDNMVLRRAMKAPLYGMADPGEKVQVEFLDRGYKTGARRTRGRGPITRPFSRP